MKKFVVTFLQFLLFLLVYAVGSFLRPFHLHWGLTVTSPSVTRYFVPDGLLLALGLFVVIAVIQIIRKRLSAATLTTLAFVLAVVVGYAIKLGFVTQDF
jgi:hypothetical protein